jgi:EpsI family protein
VPLISGYVIWLRRDKLRTINPSPSLGLGLLVFMSGIALLVLGRASSTNLLEETSLPVTITGLSLLLLGRQMTLSLTFPIAYLFAMIPFWEYFTGHLQSTFQLYSATVGVGALRLLDIPVARDGVFIHLPNITLEVADVCSGVNQLVAILCVGIPVAHMHIRRWSRRLAVVFAAILIALLSNGLRVAIVSLFAYYGIRGPNGDVHGPYSLARTMLISGVGFISLFWLIARFSDTSPAQAATTSAAPASRPRVSLLAVAIAVGAMSAVTTVEAVRKVVPVAPAARLAGFPTSLGGWQFVGDAPLTAATGAIVFDHRLSRRYAAADGGQIDLLIGYYETQRQGSELVAYGVSQLLAADLGPFQWQFGDVEVKDFIVGSGSDPSHVTYWFVVGKRLVASEVAVKGWTAWNTLVHERSHGGIVVIRSNISPGEPLESARARVKDFVEAALRASREQLSGS